MFVELIISLWAKKNEKDMSSVVIIKSARAIRQKLSGLRGLPSTLRHIFCISKVSEIVYHNNLSRRQQLIPSQCPGMFPYFQASACGRADKLPIYRPLGQLFFSSDILSGEEAAKLRSYCSEAWINFDKDFKDPCGILIEDADLPAFQDYFQGRVQHFGGRQHEAAQETYKLRWGPTRIPIYVALLAFTTLNPPRRYKYFAIAEWLVDTAKVPVDGM